MCNTPLTATRLAPTMTAGFLPTKSDRNPDRSAPIKAPTENRAAIRPYTRDGEVVITSDQLNDIHLPV